MRESNPDVGPWAGAAVRWAAFLHVLDRPERLGDTGDAATRRLVREFLEDASFPLLYSALKRSGVLEDLGPGIREAVRRDAFQSGAHFENQRAQCVDVLTSLNARGVEPLILKGLGLGTRFYADPWLRPFSDLDIMVPPDSLDACRAALLGLGYRPFPSFSAYYGNRLSKDSTFLWDGPGKRISVEVHHALLYPRGDRRSRKTDPLLEGAEPLDLGGPSAKGLRREAESVFLIAHTLVQHRGFHRFLWFYDILRVAGIGGEHLDRDSFQALARAAGIESLAVGALEGMRGVRALSDGAAGDPLSAHLGNPSVPPDSEPPGQGFLRKYEQFRYAEGPAAVYHYLFDSVFPDRAYLEWAYPKVGVALWRLRAERLIDLAGRALGRPSRLRRENE